jgi:anti-sigma-K factor RskA
MSADVHALAGAYALNALPADEQAFFERHLASCEACRAEVAELQETAATLAAGAAATPSASLRASVLAAADVTRQLPPAPAAQRPADGSAWNRMRQRVLVPLAAALALAVVALTVVVVDLNQRLPQSEPPSTAVVGVLGAPDLQTVDLDLGAAVPGRFLYSPSQDQGVLVAHGVADPGSHETYELWLIHDGTPVPAGLFRPDDAGATIAETSAPVRGAELVAITVEPAGGSEQPTGAVLASAPLEG